MRGRYPQIQQRMIKLRPQQIKIPAVVKAELLLGALKSDHPKRTGGVVNDFIAPFEVAPFDDYATKIYARIRYELERIGKPIGPNDLIIAATTIAQGATLVTHNIKEFSRIKSLKIVDWTGV
jgi:tRNA(fMet)-specific endonuclease VapC